MYSMSLSCFKWCVAPAVLGDGVEGSFFLSPTPFASSQCKEDRREKKNKLKLVHMWVGINDRILPQSQCICLLMNNLTILKNQKIRGGGHNFLGVAASFVLYNMAFSWFAFVWFPFDLPKAEGHSALLTLLTGLTSMNLFLTPSDLFSLFPSVVACTCLLESELLDVFLFTSGLGFVSFYIILCCGLV